MVAAFYRRPQSIAGLRDLAGTTRQGTNLAGLTQAAISIGFRPRAVRVHREAFSGITLPAIAHWLEDGRNHFVVVFRHGRKHVVVGDPAIGRRRLEVSAFHRCWTGTLLLLEPTPELRALSASPLHTLCQIAALHRKTFVDAVIAASFMALLSVASSFFIQVLVDFVIPSGGRATLNWLAAGMLVVLLARSAFLTLRGLLLAHLAQRIDAEIVMNYHHSLMRLPLTFFFGRRTGELAARLHDAVKVRNALGVTGLAVLVDSAILVIAVSAMFWLDWHLALISVGILPVLGITLSFLTPAIRRAQETALERAAGFEAHTVEAIDAVQSVRALHAEHWMCLRGESRFAAVLDSVYRLETYSVWSSSLATFLGGIASLALLWAGGHAVIAGELTVGRLMALYTLLGTASGPVERLASANQTIQEALAASRRVGEILALRGEDDGSQEKNSTDRTITGEVMFERVRFAYGASPPLFDNFTLCIAAGECCRISGRSGSGKSTLARLLARLYEPTAGRILVDGIDVRDYSLRALRTQVAYVSQESSLLSASVADNIRLGRPEATLEEVRGAARLAGAHDFVEAAPQGYGSLLGEKGLSISGGERQRLILARAILGNPPVLILDEPTNHLDPPSVQAVTRLIERRRRNRRTTILISHDTLPFDRTVPIDD